MNYSIHRLSFDLKSRGVQSFVTLRRGESGHRLEVSISDEGKVYEISPDCSAVFAAKKPDNTQILNECTIHDNIIFCDISAQTTAAAGKVDCEIRLYGRGEMLIIAPKFGIFIENTAIDENGIESSDEFSALDRLIERAENAVTYSAISEAQAVIDDEPGRACVSVTQEDAPIGKRLIFSFSGLKGTPGSPGEKGEKGEKGESGVYVGGGEIPEGCKVQIDPNGEVLELVEEAPEDDKLYVRSNGVWVETGASGGGSDAMWRPTVAADGTLSWEKSGTQTAPDRQNIKGPKGEDGAQGERGIQGIQGEKGEKGEDGSDGADGHSPVKGTDYWTAADKEEILEELIEALQAGSGISLTLVGGLTEPQAVLENMLWIKTQESIACHSVSSCQPESPVEGQVWLEERYLPLVEINIPNSDISLSICRCWQYIAGQWEWKEAAIYKDGSWHGVGTYLFKEGVGYNGIVFGSYVKGSAVTVGSEISFGSGSYEYSATINTAGLIEHGRYRYVMIDMLCTGNSSAGPHMYFSASARTNPSSPAQSELLDIVLSNSSVRTTVCIDISMLEQDFSPAIYGANNLKIYNLWFV